MNNITNKEMRLIDKIVKRGWKMMNDCYRDQLSMIMDLTFTHVNTPLRLNDLLIADDLNFNHDIIGICNNLNRSTKKLNNCFIPRYIK